MRIGDIWIPTVREYLTSSRMTRFNYRLVRNPFILFVFALSFLFMVLERFLQRNVNRGTPFCSHNEFCPADLVRIHEFNIRGYSIHHHPSYHDGRSWHMRYFGSSMFSTNLKILIGHREKTGTSLLPLWKVVATKLPGIAMVLRKYWLSSYSPSQCHDSKL